MKQRRRFIIPVFIPHAGCRFRCVFCDQHAVTGNTASRVDRDAIRETVYRHRETSPRWEGERELAFFGGSFSALPQARQEELLAVGHDLIKEGAVQALRVSTRPDALDEGSVDRLVRSGVGTIEIGVQSMDDDVLSTSRRGHTVSDVVRAARLLTDRHVEWIAQIMPGLPGDTDETIIGTAVRVAELAPDGARIYPALVISGTEMERMYQRGDYTPLSLSRAVGIATEIVEIFEKKLIPIIRIGLCPSTSLERRVVAGPYHPAFGSLVYEARLLDEMIDAVGSCASGGRRIVIRVHPHDVSRAVGNGRSSITRLRRHYPDSDIDIVGDRSVDRGKVEAHAF
jgi:histone acetyltransferase (RNA polymerase elongator complex component)